MSSCDSGNDRFRSLYEFCYAVVDDRKKPLGVFVKPLSEGSFRRNIFDGKGLFEKFVITFVGNCIKIAFTKAKDTQVAFNNIGMGDSTFKWSYLRQSLRERCEPINAEP
jgi:hypothetical protein